MALAEYRCAIFGLMIILRSGRGRAKMDMTKTRNEGIARLIALTTIKDTRLKIVE
jgi:hypothetical protein